MIASPTREAWKAGYRRAVFNMLPLLLAFGLAGWLLRQCDVDEWKQIATDAVDEAQQQRKLTEEAIEAGKRLRDLAGNGTGVIQ